MIYYQPVGWVFIFILRYDKNGNSSTETGNVVGKLCGNNDQFAKDRELPVLNIEDTVIIHNAGAHSCTVGHNYNSRTRSDEYLLKQYGSFKHIKRTETVENLYRTVLNFKYHEN